MNIQGNLNLKDRFCWRFMITVDSQGCLRNPLHCKLPFFLAMEVFFYSILLIYFSSIQNNLVAASVNIETFVCTYLILQY